MCVIIACSAWAASAAGGAKRGGVRLSFIFLEGCHAMNICNNLSVGCLHTGHWKPPLGFFVGSASRKRCARIRVAHYSPCRYQGAFLAQVPQALHAFANICPFLFHLLSCCGDRLRKHASLVCMHVDNAVSACFARWSEIF